MAGKQAKTLNEGQMASALHALLARRYPVRDTAIFLLSIKAGLRAGEIAALTWPMVLAADGTVAETLELHDRAAKKLSGRTIPLNPGLRAALEALAAAGSATSGPIIRSERGSAFQPITIVNWFARLYQQLGFEGCSSHSGRRTFITRAARLIAQTGGSLRDVQQLAGHRSLGVTQGYIEGDTEAKRRLVALV